MSHAPAAAPGQAASPHDWIPGPPGTLSRQATAWTVVGYVMFLVVSPLVDGAEDEGMMAQWEPGWLWLVLMLTTATFAAALVLAWRGARPKAGGRTTGSRRRLWWLAVLAGVPAAWSLLLALVLWTL